MILFASMMNFVRCFSLFTYFVFQVSVILADDPGITKVRLIQQTDSVYLLEADVPQVLLNTIREPIFPVRFEMTDFNYTNQSGWITLQMTITAKGEGLTREDEILLPWFRNGIDFTAQWSDGETFKGLFNRSSRGIVIPLTNLLPSEKSTMEVLHFGFTHGLEHVKFIGLHLMFVLVLFLVFNASRAFKILLFYSLGQVTSMVITELTFINIEMLYSEILLAAVILLFSYYGLKHKEIKYAWFIMMICGFIHGASFIHDTQEAEFSTLQKVQALFAFNMAIDLGHYVFGFTAFVLGRLLRKFKAKKNRIMLFSGSMGVFFIFLLFTGYLGRTSRSLITRESNSAPKQVDSKTRIIGTGTVIRGTGLMTTPIMVYLSVEPFEIRQEVLIKAKEAMRILAPDFEGPQIAVEDQEYIKKGILHVLQDSSQLMINDAWQKPADSKVHFVSLSRGGVSIRETPIPEDINSSIIGLTQIYDINAFPDSLRADWRLFSDSVRLIEASVVDPHGALTQMVTPTENTVRWKSRLSGYKPADVEAIVIKRSEVPLVSLLLLSVAITLIILIAKSKSRKSLLTKFAIGLLFIGFALYPFFRMDLSLPVFIKGKPNNENATLILNDLLTNVYKSFDRRKEEDVYDRLALSVTGDQLSEIYLQNRQAMALENRGGARASVDEIKILDVTDITRTSDDAVVANTIWTVRGSVNHFGHTHYRQNQYQALVSFINDNQIWKINSIETIDEKRIY